MALGFALVIIGVLARYVFNLPIQWSNELIGYVFTWVGFLAIAANYGERSLVNHIQIALLRDRLPPHTRRWWDVGVHVTSLAFLVLVGLEGVKYVQLGRYLSASSMPIEMSWFYLIVPISGGLAALNLLARVLKLIIEDRGTA